MDKSDLMDKPDALIGDVRRLDASDLGEEWWENGVVDFEAEVRDLCLMM